ncbi:hypothetical protein N8I77_000242 [Diaporthe amygdali]|uniref:Uncharacterized protein n=1 Tax=Phomopsis amygdali TaxID=1214568 RepID=A0AAD9W8W0_PHOAM|nr:hypothetical protein N8I77_000242 [Diaporthe amygdali]
MVRRGIIPPVKGIGAGAKGGAADIPSTNGVTGGGYPRPISPGSATPDSDVPRLGQGSDDIGTYKPPVIGADDTLSSPNQSGSGTASSSTNPCARSKDSCDAIKDVAEELVGQIIDASGDAAGPESSSGVSDAATPSTSLSAVTPSPTPMPNLNTSMWMDLSNYEALFTEDEYSMLKDDPLCFYANFGRLYENYANESTASESTASATGAAPASKRTARAGPRGADSDLGYNYAGGDPGTSAADASQDSDDEEAASTLYLSYLPDQLRLVYTATPTSLTVTAVATTTCSGLSDLGIESFATPYVVFGYREEYSAIETESASSSSVVSGVSGNGAVPWSEMVMLGLLWFAKMF